MPLDSIHSILLWMHNLKSRSSDVAHFYKMAEAERLLQIIHEIRSHPALSSEWTQLDWTQQIGIYLDKTAFSPTKLFQTHNFSSNDWFHAIEAFENYIGDYWSSALHFLCDRSWAPVRKISSADHRLHRPPLQKISRTSWQRWFSWKSPDHLARMF